MQQNRLKSPVVWTAITAQLLAILVTVGVVNTGLSDVINGLIVSALQVLVAVGVLNNPTDGQTF